MSGNVVALSGAVLPGAVNDELVRHIEGHLARAKKGEIVSGAYALTTANGMISTGWDVMGDDSFRMTAAVSLLNQRVLAALDEAGE